MVVLSVVRVVLFCRVVRFIFVVLFTVDPFVAGDVELCRTVVVPLLCFAVEVTAVAVAVFVAVTAEAVAVFVAVTAEAVAVFVAVTAEAVAAVAVVRVVDVATVVLTVV